MVFVLVIIIDLGLRLGKNTGGKLSKLRRVCDELTKAYIALFNLGRFCFKLS